MVFTIKVKDTENEEDVNVYFEALADTFTKIVNLSAFGFDTTQTLVVTGDDNG